MKKLFLLSMLLMNQWALAEVPVRSSLDGLVERVNRIADTAERAKGGMEAGVQICADLGELGSLLDVETEPSELIDDERVLLRQLKHQAPAVAGVCNDGTSLPVESGRQIYETLHSVKSISAELVMTLVVRN